MSKMSIILISVLLLAGSLKAQTISGYVKDHKGSVLSGATVSLLRAGDSVLVKLQVSGADGSFGFATPDTGRYLILATSVGYQAVYSPELAPGATAVLRLPEAASDLEEVVVQAGKPMVQVRADRMIVNVEGTANATGNNMLELLRKFPSVTVNGEDRISMNGRNGVQIFIDGKPVPLSGDELAAYLKSISSMEVEAIELIAHPSARFEAAGNAGIINIRLKKNRSLGTNGMLTAGFNGGVYGKYNAGLSLNHRTAKWNLFGSFSPNGGTTRKLLTMDRRIMDSAFAQQGVIREQNRTFNFKGGADYFPGERHTIGLLVNGNFSDGDITNSSRTSIGPAGGSPSRFLEADNLFSSGRDHLDVNLNYLHAGAGEKTLNLNADWGFYGMKGVQLQPNAYYDARSRQLLHTVTYEMHMPSRIDIYSLKGDYEQPLRKGRLGAGFKSSYVTTDNDFRRYTIEENVRSFDYGRSNRFAYREALNAAYLQYSRQWNHLQLQAGLRAEHTGLKGNSRGKKQSGGTYLDQDSTIRQEYLDLFPSLSLQYSKSPDHQFNFSFSRRIDRPAYQDLNPFEFKVDDYLIQRGNSWLRPQYTNGLGIGYVFRHRLNSSLNYSSVSDLAAWILDTTETSKSVAYRENLGRQKLISLNLSYPIRYGNYSLFASLSGSYASFQGDLGAGRRIDQRAFGLNLFAQNTLKLKKDWTAELAGFYYSPSLQEGNMRVKSFWSVDAAVQKKWKDDRFLLKLAVSDLFNTLQFRSHSSFAGQVVRYNTKNETRQVKLSLSFRLGSKEVKSARQRSSGAEAEMKRVN